MDKLIYLISILVILFSYAILERALKKYFPKLVPYQLWDSKGYYLWALVLIIIYLIVKPNDYIIKIPINNDIAFQYLFFFAIGVLFVCISVPNFYYPRKACKFRCFQYSIVQPILEEVSFRGLILPLSTYFIGNDLTTVLLLNGILFMLFHLNYWGYKKERIGMFLNFLIAGVFFNYITIITHSIIYSILCHIMINGGNTLYRNWKNK